MNEQPCPFCPLLLEGEPENHLPIGNDFFGEPAMIGDVRSCEACARVAEMAGIADELLAELKSQAK